MSNTRVLCGEWQGWLTSLGNVIAVDFGGAMPDAGNWTAEHIAYLDELATHLRALSRRLGAAAFSLNQSAAGLAAMVADARRFATAQAPLRGVPGEQDRWRTAVALQGAAAALLAQVTAPVMPRFSAALAAALGMKPVTSWPALPQLLPAATPITLADAVFFQPVAARPPARAAAE